MVWATPVPTVPSTRSAAGPGRRGAPPSTGATSSNITEALPIWAVDNVAADPSRPANNRRV